MNIKRMRKRKRWAKVLRFLEWYVWDPFWDFLLDYWWAQLIFAVVLTIVLDLIAMFLLALLAAAGYIPLPQW